MIKSYLKIASRNLFKFKTNSTAALISLAFGIASFVLLLLYFNYELSYDKWAGSLMRAYS